MTGDSLIISCVPAQPSRFNNELNQGVRVLDFPLSAVLYVADRGLHLIGKREAISTGLRSVGIIVTLIVLGLLQLLPLLGGLINFLLLLFGLGALSLKSWRDYKAA